MKKITVLLAGLGIAAATLPATANAQPWQSINARQARIEAQIDQGVRSGRLSRAESRQLRAEFRGIAQIEATYRRSRPGLTLAERRDLDRRFDALQRKVVREKRDFNNRPGRR